MTTEQVHAAYNDFMRGLTLGEALGVRPRLYLGYFAAADLHQELVSIRIMEEGENLLDRTLYDMPIKICPSLPPEGLKVE